MLNYNPILDTDAYKASHWEQYPPNADYMFSYLESRGGKHPQTLFFGLQYILLRYLSQRILPSMVDEAEEVFGDMGLPFNREGWMRIAKFHGGRLPVTIKAVPEGTLVPTGNVLMTIESQDPELFWLPAYLETILMRVWYPITVATQSFYMKLKFLEFHHAAEEKPFVGLDYKLHDFGARGVSSCESSGIGAMAHLVNFKGTDTVMGNLYAKEYYSHPCAGESIPAAEHSTITSWGRDNEAQAYLNMLNLYAQKHNALAVVSDSYDLYSALEHIWGDELKQNVQNANATIVLRPDSGDPVSVLIKSLQILQDKFGVRTNSKGYWVLNNVRLLQGDGVTPESIGPILYEVLKSGYAPSNVSFGMGGGLLQQVNRDTQKFAMKCSAIGIDGKLIPVSKDPATDPGKASKKGKLDLIRDEKGFRTIQSDSEDLFKYGGRLKTVYQNGTVTRYQHLETIRTLAEGSLRGEGSIFKMPTV